MSTSDELPLLQASHVWIQFNSIRSHVYDQFTATNDIRLKSFSPIEKMHCIFHIKEQQTCMKCIVQNKFNTTLPMFI